jgi:hypothetical protein
MEINYSYKLVGLKKVKSFDGLNDIVVSVDFIISGEIPGLPKFDWALGDVPVDIPNVETFKPFDEHAVIESIKKTRVFITLDELSKEHNLFQLIQRSIAGKIIAFGEQVTVTDFVRLYGKYDQILDEIGFRPEQIAKMIKSLISKKNQLNER